MQSVILEKSYGSARVFWLDRDLLRRKIKEAAEGLLEKCGEVKDIILFGSAAANRVSVGSDIDIVIIVKDSQKRFIDRALKYRPYFSNIKEMCTDLFVYTEKELEENKIPILKSALKTGVIFSRKTGNNA